MEDALIYWNSDPSVTGATAEEIDHFDARGMQRVNSVHLVGWVEVS